MPTSVTKASSSVAPDRDIDLVIRHGRSLFGDQSDRETLTARFRFHLLPGNISGRKYERPRPFDKTPPVQVRYGLVFNCGGFNEILGRQTLRHHWSTKNQREP